ncbi:hypothetical protein C8R44DRAFT_985233 [Mycena epipterygia]|nr:hypothetical protein C8R44DRAFT_985233 [Mycena epipterygia]
MSAEEAPLRRGESLRLASFVQNSQKEARVYRAGRERGDVMETFLAGRAKPLLTSRDHLSPDRASTPSSTSSTASTPVISASTELPPTFTEGGDSSLFDCFLPRSAPNGLLPTFIGHRFPSAEPLPVPIFPASPMTFSEYSGNPIALPSLPEFDHAVRNYPSNCDPSSGLAPGRANEFFAVRNLFLDRCWHYGLNVTAEKWDALSRGDTSGLVVHPVLVNICQLLGYFIANNSQFEPWRYFPGAREGEVEQALLIFHVLQKSHNILDPMTSMQASTLFALYCALKGDIAMFTELFGQLGQTVLHNDSALGFLDTLLLDATLSLDSPKCCPQGPAQEAQSAFCGMVFLELTGRLVLNITPILDPSILAKFRRLVALYSTHTEMNFMRAKSALLIFDSQQLVVEWGRWELGDSALAMWSKRYWRHMDDIQAHINVVNTSLVQSSFVNEAQVLTLRSCGMMALAALAELYTIFAPFEPESRHKYNEIIAEILAIKRMFSEKGFKYLETPLVICRTIASRANFDEGWDDSSGVRSQGSSQVALDIIRECNRKLRHETSYAL